MNEASSDMPVIALLGGVGAGKSTVARMLEQLGCMRIDADAIAHEVLDEPQVRQQLNRRWGGEGGRSIFGPDGKVDRGVVGEIVFGDPAELAALSAIVHPLVRVRMECMIDQARRDSAVRAVVLDAAVLLEARCEDLCTHMVFIESTPAARAARVGEQRGWDEAQWRAREKSQKPLDTKAEMCDYTIVNSSSVSHLAEQIREILNCIVGVSR